jgi:hypothetical protein
MTGKSALRGALTLFGVATLVLWLVSVAFSVDVPITWASAAAMWALLVVLGLLFMVIVGAVK